mgnify:CR=1 FL=1
MPTKTGQNWLFCRNLSTIIQSNDTSGKLYKYDARTKTLSLLLNGLSGPLGVAVSKCGAYVLIDEYIASRVRRYWVRGPKAGFSEILVNLPGSPDNIKRTISGEFFAAVTILNRQTFQTTSSVGQRINGDLGIVEATVNLTAQYTNNLISEVQEFLGKLYIGSSTASFVGVYGPWRINWSQLYNEIYILSYYNKSILAYGIFTIHLSCLFV